MTIQIKAIEQFFPAVLFIVLYKVVLTFESVDEILKGATSRITHLEKTGKFFQVCHS